MKKYQTPKETREKIKNNIKTKSREQNQRHFNFIQKKLSRTPFKQGLTQEYYQIALEYARAGYEIVEEYIKGFSIEMTRYKIYDNAKNASEVRCKQRKAYKDKWKMGDHREVWKVMQKDYPEMFEEARQIVENYIRNKMQSDYTLTFHRIDNDGNYAWDNIQMLSRAEHYKLHSKEEAKRKFKLVRGYNNLVIHNLKVAVYKFTM